MYFTLKGWESTLITAKPVPSHNTSVHFTDIAQFAQQQSLG